MATFKERRAPTSKKYVAEQGIVIQNWSKILQIFVALLRFCFRKATQKSNSSESFLSLIDPLVTTFNERRAPTLRKQVAEQGIVMPKWLKIIETFRSHYSVFALETQPKNPILQSLFISNRPFAGYFQWNARTDFQKICSWTKYTDIKLIKKFSTFRSHSSVFLYEKQSKNLNFESFFSSNRLFRAYFQWRVHRVPGNMQLNKV